MAEIVHAAPLATALPPPVIEVAELAPPVPEPMEEGAVEPPADAMQPEPLAPAAAPAVAPAAAHAAPLPPLDQWAIRVLEMSAGLDPAIREMMIRELYASNPRQ